MSEVPSAPIAPMKSKSRPKPPYRKNAGSPETVSTMEAGSDPGTAVTGASTGLSRQQYFQAESPLAESDPEKDSEHTQAVRELAQLRSQLASQTSKASGQPAQVDASLLRHIDHLFEKNISNSKLNELIAERVKAHGIEQNLHTHYHVEAMVAKHTEGFLDQRMRELVAELVQKDIDVIVEANMATREIVKDVGNSDLGEDAVVDAETVYQVNPSAGGDVRSVEEVEALVKAHLELRESELEKRVSERIHDRLQEQSERIQGRLQEQLQQQVQEHISVSSEQLQQQVQERISVSLSSRPPTSQRPFSSNRQARPTPQDKATWTAPGLYTVAATPNHDASSRALTHVDLEADVTAKVLAKQPDRSGLGYDEIVMRDIANSVVRELVGIFESLVDRLLIEKKEDTLRALVAELITEDTHKLWAAGSEQLRQREYGHLHQELERLGREARDLHSAWEEKFQITDELRDSQDDLYTTLDERLRPLEARLSAMEQDSISQTQFAKYRQELSADMTGLRGQVTQAEEKSTGACAEVAQHRKSCEAELATWKHTSWLEEHLMHQIKRQGISLEEELKDLREFSASKEALKTLQANHEERFTKVDTGIFEASSSAKEAHENLKKSYQHHEDLFVTKKKHSEVSEKLRDQITATGEKLQPLVDNLEVSKATKEELQDAISALESAQSKTNSTLSKSTRNLERTTDMISDLERRIDKSMATRTYVDEKTRGLMEEALERNDCKEELGQVWKELDTERERIRQALAQQQHLRRDFCDANEIIEQQTASIEKISTELSLVSEGVKSLDQRELQHFDSGQEASWTQRRALEDLQALYKALREDFVSHKELSRAEAERLKKHSTERYLEQIDKALNLTQSLEQVSRGHNELKDSIRGIKLPKVVDKGSH